MENIEDMLRRTIDSVKSTMDCDMVVGKPILAADGSTVLPISKISYGFVTGGGEYGAQGRRSGEYPYTAVGGGGVTVTPVGFLMCGVEKKFLRVDKSESTSKWMDFLKSAINVMDNK